MLHGAIVAIIGSYIGAWLILSAVNGWDRHQARKHRAAFDKRLAAKGQTRADWEEYKATRRFEEHCNREYYGE